MSSVAPVPGGAEHRRLRWKAHLARPLFATGLHRLLMRGRGVIVAFHRVDDRVRGNPIGCGVDEYRRYLDFFQRHFTIVPLSEMLDRVQDGRGPGGRLSITFDDGYLDNHRVAAPELRARGLPACFFVTSGFIGTRTQPWWDVEYGARAEWMAWSHVRELHAQGFEIGAHTVTHADLGRASAAEADAELRRSREVLERELGAPVTLFSFPYGAPQRMTAENRARVAAAGYRCCLSGYGGTVGRGADPYLLRRAPIGLWHVSPEHLGFELLFREPRVAEV
jgi:peptidoglycan/xylan/chitin deacetylase (PgdA/CDA1 family)